MGNFKKRLSEPSTYAGLALLLSGAQQYFLDQAEPNAVITTIAGGLLSVFLGESKNK